VQSKFSLHSPSRHVVTTRGGQQWRAQDNRGHANGSDRGVRLEIERIVAEQGRGAARRRVSRTRGERDRARGGRTLGQYSKAGRVVESRKPTTKKQETGKEKEGDQGQDGEWRRIGHLHPVAPLIGVPGSRGLTAQLDVERAPRSLNLFIRSESIHGVIVLIQ
jgi:hypothetical protein